MEAESQFLTSWDTRGSPPFKTPLTYHLPLRGSNLYLRRVLVDLKDRSEISFVLVQSAKRQSQSQSIKQGRIVSSPLSDAPATGGNWNYVQHLPHPQQMMSEISLPVPVRRPDWEVQLSTRSQLCQSKKMEVLISCLANVSYELIS